MRENQDEPQEQPPLDLSGIPPEVLEQIPENIRNNRDLLAVHLKFALNVEPDTIAQDAKEKGRELKKSITDNPQQLWFPMAPMPTDMCRVSPFFPLSKNELGDREYIKDLVISDGPWGRIRYSGPKLSVYEEDFLMSLLALIDDAKHRETTELEGGKQTYSYRGTLLPVLKYAGLSRGQANYDYAKRALKLMHTTALELEIFKRDSRGKRKVARWTVTNLLSVADLDEQTKTITITINPYFYEVYASGNVTLIDVVRRSKIKSPIAKSLYRFVQSHQGDEWTGHFLTLSTALNLNTDLPPRKLKERVKMAIRDLVKRKILLPESGFLTGETVTLRRHPSTQIRRKALK